ncbi:MAG: hypothetical protein V3U03_16130 [Myxococcota bacterium]
MAVLHVALVLAYPALVYLALGVTSPRLVALGVLVLVVARGVIASRGRRVESAVGVRLPLFVAGAAMLVTAAWNDPLALLATPALISFALLIVFAGSLGRRECIVESFARAQRRALSDHEIRYCRRVTVVWCAFFLLNGALALGLAVAATRTQWALYTGAVAYLLMGSLYAAEFVYRQWRFRPYCGAPSDALFRRIFPPRLPGGVDGSG